MSDRSHLEEISIRAIGVIDEATLELGPGFTVLTGETGAGKTMVLTALSLVLGGKSDSSLVRQGQERLIASASFRVPMELKQRAQEIGADLDDDLLILTRSVNSQSKSKSSAGGLAVPTGVLAELGDELIEIHAQSASMSITKASKQREILDRFAGTDLTRVLSEYRSMYSAYSDLHTRIVQLKSNVKDRENEISLLKEFTENFAKVKPIQGEFDEVIQEISRLSSVEELRGAAQLAAELLSDDEMGVLTTMTNARRALESAALKDATLEKISQNLAESFFLANDASHAVHSYLQNLEADPVRLDFLQNRRADISALVKRYAQGAEIETQVRELITRNENSGQSLQDLVGGDERLSGMETELKALLKALLASSAELTKMRNVAAIKLASEVSMEIHALSMPHTNLICQVLSPQYESEVSFSQLSINGADEISMLLQGHKDGPLVPIAKGASGGELSRVLLALEVVLAQSAPVGTYVFDEVDAGVGGKAAVEVGRRLWNLSKHAQVIVVTHLPQVAAWADAHFVVRKSNDGSVSQSDVQEVTGDGRVTEIARMLAGQEDSRSAQEHAAELLAMRG